MSCSSGIGDPWVGFGIWLFCATIRADRPSRPDQAFHSSLFLSPEIEDLIFSSFGEFLVSAVETATRGFFEAPSVGGVAETVVGAMVPMETRYLLFVLLIHDLDAIGHVWVDGFHLVLPTFSFARCFCTTSTGFGIWILNFQNPIGKIKTPKPTLLYLRKKIVNDMAY